MRELLGEFHCLPFVSKRRDIILSYRLLFLQTCKVLSKIDQLEILRNRVIQINIYFDELEPPLKIDLANLWKAQLRKLCSLKVPSFRKNILKYLTASYF